MTDEIMDILKEFGVDPILLAAQVVNFLVLLFILKRFLYGPILKVLETRKKKIEESLKNAEEIEKQLFLTEEGREKVLVKAQTEMQKMLDEAKKEIEVMKSEGKEQATAEAQLIIKKSEETADAKIEKAKQELMLSFGEIMAVGMEKISGKSFSKKDMQDIIAREIKNLS